MLIITWSIACILVAGDRDFVDLEAVLAEHTAAFQSELAEPPFIDVQKGVEPSERLGE